MPHTGGSKSITTLMDEKDENGIEPTRAQVFIVTHKPRKDGRQLDEESARTIDMINEKLSNSEGSNEQPSRSVAWEGDVYSQVLGNEKIGYVHGLGLGPTPYALVVDLLLKILLKMIHLMRFPMRILAMNEYNNHTNVI
ncbi:hypothetical protein HAX54_018108 [Datura stramonium]|uniref:Uncharacterized protein n=1 Tax=Datura stramonium TaxID=4076 RepID=A0ABS8UNA7_DATST|nr:hypothetical protein [Datura stramonium]